MLYEITKGSVSLGGETILDHIDFYIKGREKAALVGRNGSGKTTLLRLLAGELSPDRDDKHHDSGLWMARKTSIGMLSQSAFTAEELAQTVEALVMEGCPSDDPWSEEYGSYAVEFGRIFAGLGFTQTDMSRQVVTFSGGEQTRIALIRLLLTKPDILLLDEPTNHLDLEAVMWLEEYLLAWQGALVLVSHDRFFLDRIVDVVWELRDGKVTRYAGNYSSYREARRKQQTRQERSYKNQQQEIQRLTALIDKYKHKPRKASMARSKKKVLERMVKVERPLPDQAAIFTEPVIPAKPGPKRVITADKLKIGYDHPLQEITFTLRRGQKIGMIGANGTGKTTFLKTVAGIIPPLSGTCLQGQGVSAGYYDQMSARTGSDQRVLEHFSKEFPLMPLQDVRKVLGRYLFSGEDAAKRLSDLSGGEISRLYLAELLQSCPNLLLLDEPTNHMDIPAKETLESAFKMYGGTMLFISHDRYFIKEIATSLLIFEEDKVLYYPFGYEHYLEALRKEKERGADQKAAILAENARIVQELHAVPDRKRMQSARLNTDQSYTDWQLQLASEALEKAAASLSLLLSERDHLPAASASEYEENCRNWKKRFEEKMSDYHDLCLVWYDKYTDYEYAFYSYRE